VLVALCAVLGLLLATPGTYGITARSVVERTREVGIRLALGGGASHVLRTVAWGSLRAVLAGAAAGAAASSVAGALLTTLLPELQQPDWRFSAAAAGTLVFVASVAALAAARGAISLAPLRALGVE
jgi:ABC-type lipoprotein release transport system permease subunit